MTSYLIVHGWQNRRPAGHWQRWLADSLRSLGHNVFYPQLPDPDHPSPARWARALAEQLEQLERMGDSRRVVICHSLGCMGWLHLATTGHGCPVVDGLLFVAPPGRGYLAATPELAAFAPPEPVGELLRATCPTGARLVCSDNDPYCEAGADREYPRLFDVDVLAGAGHLDIPAGYGAWPSLLAWCADPRVRITANPARAEVTGR